jgi:2-dehydro-3-deoxyphosphooctonate aldolase (KDO 8-P synthase)
MSMTMTFTVGSLTVGNDERLTLIGGPCVLEEPDTNTIIGETLRDLCAEIGMGFVLKASFDKANRSSVGSPRGPGLDAGRDELDRRRRQLGVPVTTDVPEPAQVAQVAEVADLLQVPAFLCRQTDLLLACAATGRPVNVKKGQFMSPVEMKHVVGKLQSGGCAQIMLTERGTFFGYHRLVNDFIGLGDLVAIGCPVCFDATHSTQLPGAEAKVTGGRPDRAPLLARAAVAAGVQAIFLECHPRPAQARSDASTAQPLDGMAAILRPLVAIRAAMTAAGGGGAAQIAAGSGSSP